MLRPLLFFAQGLAAALAIGDAHVSGSVGPSFDVVARPPAAVEAPADVYFGRYKLSNLGVRNAISDMTIEGDSPLALPQQISRIAAVESALPDWANRYPHDPWLPSAIGKFSAFLISKHEPAYDRSALAWLYLLETWYPNTWYSKYAQEKLASLDLSSDLELQADPAGGQLARISDGDFPAIGANHRRR